MSAAALVIVLQMVEDAGGTVLKTALAETKEQNLRDAPAKAAAARSDLHQQLTVN